MSNINNNHNKNNNNNRKTSNNDNNCINNEIAIMLIIIAMTVMITRIRRMGARLVIALLALLPVAWQQQVTLQSGDFGTLNPPKLGPYVYHMMVIGS